MNELKLFDKVYQHDNGGNIYESEIIGISGATDKPVIYDCGFLAFDHNAIGKSIFLTKEDAEKHYKEVMQNDEL